MGKEKSDAAIDKREQLLRISDLNMETIQNFNDKQFQGYVETLISAINIFPLQRDKLESAFRDKDYALALQWMNSIRNRLSQIHADNIVKEYDKHIHLYQDITAVRHEKMKVFVDYLFSMVNMLYADVQRVLYDVDAEGPKSGALVKIKERLYTITELNAKKIEALTEEQIIPYIENLSAFQENLNAQENGLRGSFKIKQYASMLRWLSQIEEALVKIHADNLTEDCRNQIKQNKDINGIRHERLEIFVNYFMTSLNMLATDITSLNLPKLKR